MTFNNLKINPLCLQILEKQNIHTPTPIQEQAIPPVADGRDVVAIAQTGTGKTLAFGLPTLGRLAGTKRGQTAMLVLAPTRELAQQVHGVLQTYAKPLGLTTACIYGGVSMNPQADALRRGVQIVVATPGRLIDHLGRGNARLDKVSILVLDEADRMLDMGFLPDIRRILARTPDDRQTLMFSATLPPEIARLTTDMQHDPVRIEIGSVSRPADSVRQSFYAVAREGKIGLLGELLDRDEFASTLVFVRTKRGAERVARSLSRMDLPVEAIHGGYTQNRRQRAIDGFRQGRFNILVATDVASRGLDVKGITHVINFDLPSTAEDYVHRIGRTARASADGDAITFVSPGEERELRDIEDAIGLIIDRVEWHGDIQLGTGPRADMRSRGGGNRRGIGSRHNGGSRRAVVVSRF